MEQLASDIVGNLVLIIPAGVVIAIAGVLLEVLRRRSRPGKS